MALEFSALIHDILYRLLGIHETVSPAAKRLAIHILIVFGRIKTAHKTLVNDGGIRLRRQSQFRFNRAADQRPIPLVRPHPFVIDTDTRPGKGLHQCDRNTHVLKTQSAHGFESEHIADNRGHDVHHAVLLE